MMQTLGIKRFKDLGRIYFKSKSKIYKMEPIVEPVIIRKRGRPPKESRLTDTKEYFTDYYHRTNKNIICECGVEISIKRRASHYRTQLHNNLLKNRVQLHNGLSNNLGEIKILEELPTLDIHANENTLAQNNLNDTN